MSSTGFGHDSIADIPEDHLVERLLSDPLWGTEFFEFADMPQGMANRQRVLLNTAPGNFKGDIDALLCAPNHPEQAVAYQVKRIKFGINQLRNGKPSKLEEYKKLAQQATPTNTGSIHTCFRRALCVPKGCCLQWPRLQCILGDIPEAFGVELLVGME